MVYPSIFNLYPSIVIITGPILESTSMHAIFQKKGKKRAKYLKILAKMYKI